MIPRKFTQKAFNNIFLLTKPKYLTKQTYIFFSDWRKKQEIKKKIMDDNEAEKIMSDFNKRTMDFSILGGFIFFVTI